MTPFMQQARTRITLQTRTLTPDGCGGQVASWQDWPAVWGALSYGAGGSGLLDGALPESTQSAVLWLRYLPNLDVSAPEDLRVVCEGRKAAVTAIAAYDACQKNMGQTYLKMNLVFDSPSRGA